MTNEGILFIISGFAGTGKSTIAKGLTDNYDCYELSISATTRQAREYENHGEEYFFISNDEFEKMIAADELLEHANYLGNYYGTPLKWVESRLAVGKNVILEIEMQGALQVKEKFDNSILIFILPPNIGELERRLRERGSETEEQINNRIKRAKEEIVFIEKYDYVVINDDIEKSIELVHNIVQSEKFKVNRNLEYIKEYINEFIK